MHTMNSRSPGFTFIWLNHPLQISMGLLLLFGPGTPCYEVATASAQPEISDFHWQVQVGSVTSGADSYIRPAPLRKLMSYRGRSVRTRTNVILGFSLTAERMGTTSWRAQSYLERPGTAGTHLKGLSSVYTGTSGVPCGARTLVLTDEPCYPWACWLHGQFRWVTL